MKVTLFNDTGRDMHIHPATFAHGTVCENHTDIYPVETREFEVPDGTEPWIKLWDDLKYDQDHKYEGSKLTVLVSYRQNRAD